MAARWLVASVAVSAYGAFGAMYWFDPVVAWNARKVVINDTSGTLSALSKESLRVAMARRIIYGDKTIDALASQVYTAPDTLKFPVTVTFGDTEEKSYSPPEPAAPQPQK